LTARLGADDRALLEKAAAHCKVPMASLTNFRPWLAGATLEDAFYQAMGLSGLAPDKVLSAKAQAAGVSLFSEFAVKNDVVMWFGTMSPDLTRVSCCGRASILSAPTRASKTFCTARSPLPPLRPLPGFAHRAGGVAIGGGWQGLFLETSQGFF